MSVPFREVGRCQCCECTESDALREMIRGLQEEIAEARRTIVRLRKENDEHRYGPDLEQAQSSH